MSREPFRPPGAISLEEAFPTLIRSEFVLWGVAEEFGWPQVEDAARLIRSGRPLSGTLSDELRSFLLQDIANQPESVWSGVLPGVEDDEYVDIWEYGGIYYVCSDEGCAGFFRTIHGAREYIATNWAGRVQAISPS